MKLMNETSSSSDLIARRAYEIWQSEGRPAGRAIEHWQRAERELRSASSQGNPNTTKEMKAGSAAVAVESTQASNAGAAGRKSAVAKSTSKPRAAAPRSKKH